MVDLIEIIVLAAVPFTVVFIVVHLSFNVDVISVTTAVPATSRTVTVVVSVRSSIDVVVIVISVVLFGVSVRHGLYVLTLDLSDKGFGPGEYDTVVVFVVILIVLVVLQVLVLDLVTEVSEEIGTRRGSLMI